MVRVPEVYRPVLVTGVTGQVGRALISRIDDVIPLGQEDVNFAELDSVVAILNQHAPKAIINAAAYTAVDAAEQEEELAHIVNAEAVGKLAAYAFEKDIPFVHYSTDYVFPGDGVGPWKEDDVTGPLNAYGRTKLAGEQAIQAEAEKFEKPRWLIFRTSWVYDEKGKNFVNTMLRLGKDREVLSVVSDQVGAPTYAGDIAEYTLQVLAKAKTMDSFPSGIYHLCNVGETNWHGFAEAIFREASALGETLEIKDVKEISTSDYPTPAVRPLNSRMDMAKLANVFGIKMPAWEDALKRCLTNKYNAMDNHLIQEGVA